MFTFVILLSTLAALVPFVFTAMAQLLIYVKEPEKFSGQKFAVHGTIAVIAFLYSMWAIMGSGHEAVYWGFILLLAGFPVYVALQWHRRKRL
jgi:APA family basic amino acid/polyamine antiporter